MLTFSLSLNLPVLILQALRVNERLPLVCAEQHVEDGNVTAVVLGDEVVMIDVVS